MKRREFLALVGGAAALAPFAATAQPSLPVIGYLSSRSAEAETPLRTGFNRGIGAGGLCRRPECRDRVPIHRGEP